MGQDSERLTQENQPLEAVFEKIYNSRKSIQAVGHYKAEAGKGPLSRFIAVMIGIPVHPDFKPATLSITRNTKHDLWKRNFGGKKFSSKFYDAGEHKIEQVAFVKLYFQMIFSKSVYYESAGLSIGPFGRLKYARFFKIISNNHPVSENEWDFEVIIQNGKNSDLIFKYWGRMKIETGTS
jgi:hypothetical protein